MQAFNHFLTFLKLLTLYSGFRVVVVFQYSLVRVRANHIESLPPSNYSLWFYCVLKTSDKAEMMQHWPVEHLAALFVVWGWKEDWNRLEYIALSITERSDSPEEEGIVEPCRVDGLLSELTGSLSMCLDEVGDEKECNFGVTGWIHNGKENCIIFCWITGGCAGQYKIQRDILCGALREGRVQVTFQWGKLQRTSWD